MSSAKGHSSSPSSISPSTSRPVAELPFRLSRDAPYRTAVSSEEQARQAGSELVPPVLAFPPDAVPQLITPPPLRGVDPPRPPREGHEWVWYPDGFWAERQVKVYSQRSTGSPGLWRCSPRSMFATGEIQSSPALLHPTGISVPRTSTVLSIPPRGTSHPSPYLQEDTHVRLLQQPVIEAPRQHLHDDREIGFPKLSGLGNKGSHDTKGTLNNSSTAPPSPGAVKRLFLKTKRALGGSTDDKAPEDAPGIHQSLETAHPTTVAVERTRQIDDKVPEAWLGQEMAQPSTSRKIFGKAPWHRKESGESLSSVSSSVRELIRADTPPCTPASELDLQATRSTYSTSYPGNEAVRIPTPPLDQAPYKRPQGHFIASIPPRVDGSGNGGSNHVQQHAAPAGHETEAPVRAVPIQSRQGRARPQDRPIRHDLYALALRNIQRQSFSEKDPARAFEFRVRRHRPESPRCPANSNLPKTCRGVCVYHGRQAASSNLLDGGHGRG